MLNQVQHDEVGRQQKALTGSTGARLLDAVGSGTSPLRAAASFPETLNRPPTGKTGQ